MRLFGVSAKISLLGGMISAAWLFYTMFFKACGIDTAGQGPLESSLYLGAILLTAVMGWAALMLSMNGARD